MHAQFIHTKVTHLALRKTFDCSFVYASNDHLERKSLWNGLKGVSNGAQGAWMITGDFNCPLEQDDRIGMTVQSNEMVDFFDCVSFCHMADLKQTGCRYTWTNKQDGEARVFSQIDRCLVNDDWVSKQPLSFVNYLPEGLLDHSPGLIQFTSSHWGGRKYFKYFDMWGNHPRFLHIIKDIWDHPIQGTPMYKVVKKLKLLKSKLKALNKQEYSNIEERYYAAKEDFENCQSQMHLQPLNQSLIMEERNASDIFLQAKKDYQSFLSQKAKVKWLKEGDENTQFFHSSVKVRQFHNRVLAIQNQEGVWQEEPQDIMVAFEQYYSSWDRMWVQGSI
jgi:hypothetical protein